MVGQTIVPLIMLTGEPWFLHEKQSCTAAPKDLLDFMRDLVDIDAAIICFLLVIAVPALGRGRERREQSNNF